MRNCARAVGSGFSRTLLVIVLAVAPDVSAQTSNAAKLLREAEGRESALRMAIDTRKAGSPATPLLERARTLIKAYEDISRLFPTSPYSDDALWHGGLLAADAFWEFGQADERTTALRLLKLVPARFPTSSLVKQVGPLVDRLNAARVVVEQTMPKQPTVMLKAIRREALPGAMRVTLELEGEAQTFPDDLVRQIRVGRQIGTRIRVVLDLTNAAPHTTYALYNPYRVVIDFAREAPAPVVAAPVPSEPKPNGAGGFSLSRQLGLGIGRIVIDPGHGGHDPGAMNDGLSEADLVLDVALRLEKLLQQHPGVQVVMTRRSNVFVPLEERTAIANREGADLFLSIHANASEDDRARGIETYFLNFAPNPAAEAIAARENAASARTMRQLPDIVKAIALNNKIDESRDFASLVQSAMMERLKRSNKNVKDLGVKQAPFMVLIGATMPSILAEISFLTNRQDATLLRGAAYRQVIAEALFNGVMRYQRSLKAATQTVASQ
ncbi:MAG: hypothetical protein DMF88_14860 [Acidobacteria bacterium]|nr:MAG: hypothetical protein DMF88_14860 [Acidobacteriota bacterium]